MAISVARVHLKVAHAALPALLPTPPKCKMLLPCSCVAAFLPKLPAVAAFLPKLPAAAAKPSRADADERWDAHKTKSASTASSSPRSTCADSVRTKAPPPKPGRADSVERWDAHKKAAIRASSLSSSSGTPSSVVRSTCGGDPGWDVHKKCCPPPQAELLDNGDIDDTEEEEEEIVWKPRAMYAGPGFVVAAPEPTMLPMPTGFLVPVA